MTASGFDFKTLPTASLRILKDPAGSLESLYRPGKPALILGAIFGCTVGILIPLIQLMFFKMSTDHVDVKAGQVLEQCLGGLLFFASGMALSFLLRGAFGKSAGKDWQDDVYIFGGAMLVLLASCIVGGIFSMIHKWFPQHLANVIMLLGLVITAFTHYWGLVKVTRADAGRAVWIAVLALGGALLIGGLLDFSPLGGPAQAAVQFQTQLQGGFEDIFRGLGR